MDPVVKEFKNSKKERRERRKFHPGFFSVGTLCDIQVSKYTHPQPFTIKVNRLVKNGPDNYLVMTGETNPTTGQEIGYSLAYVTRVVRRAPGVAVVAETGLGESGAKDFTARYFDETRAWQAHNHHTKHRSRYMTQSVEDLVTAIANTMADPLLHVVDAEKMVALLRAENLISETTQGFWTVSSVSKKKLRSAIRRLFNKCLVNHFKAQQRFSAIMFGTDVDDAGDDDESCDDDLPRGRANEGSHYADDRYYPAI